jgi:hypothetical protein
MTYQSFEDSQKSPIQGEIPPTDASMPTLKNLRQQAKALGLIRYSKLRKKQLQELIEARLTKQDIPLNHLSPKIILKRLTRKRAWEWQVKELQALNGACLEALAVIMGVAKSGTKAQKVERLWAVAEVRGAMQDFDNPQSHEAVVEIAEEMGKKFLGRELKALCKKAKIFTPSTKYGMAAALLNWRKACNFYGMQALKNLKSA